MYFPGTLELQEALIAAGQDPGPADGIPGISTNRGLSIFKQSIGFNPRPYAGPLTLERLGLPEDLQFDLPWMQEAAKALGKHEVRNNGWLKKWLRSDGAALGDPRKLPWCGDYVDTSLRLTLPDEPRSDRLRKNPYLARNWLEFGEECEPCYGAVIVFWRGRRNGHSGHVGFAVARDRDAGLVMVRGGNQGNMASDAVLRSDRILGWRKPVTFERDLPSISNLNLRKFKISTNEA